MRTVLAREPSSEFGELVERLEQEDLFGRITATRELARFGSPAVAPLCSALRAPNPSVRRSAAEALGRIGDPAAVRPLLEALDASFEGGRPGVQRWIGVTTFAIAFALPLAVFTWLPQAPYPTAMNAELITFLVSGGCLCAYLYRRSNRGLLQLTIGEALSAIAAANPDPRIRQSVQQFPGDEPRPLVRPGRTPRRRRAVGGGDRGAAFTDSGAAHSCGCQSRGTDDLPRAAGVATPSNQSLPRPSGAEAPGPVAT